METPNQAPGRQLIGGQLKVGRLLQGSEILQELDGRRGPVWPMVPTGEFGAESGTLFEPPGAQPVKRRRLDWEMLRGCSAMDLPAVKRLHAMLEKGTGQASGQLFFSHFRMAPEGSLVKMPFSSYSRPGKKEKRGIGFPAFRVFKMWRLAALAGYSDLTFFTIAAASMPKCATSSSGLPERGRPLTASLWTLTPSLLNSPATASPRPPSE